MNITRTNQNHGDVVNPPVTEVYAVGTEKGEFVVDRVYLDRDDAVAYCQSRRNFSHRWAVYRAGVANPWFTWEKVYETLPMTRGV